MSSPDSLEERLRAVERQQAALEAIDQRRDAEIDRMRTDLIRELHDLHDEMARRLGEIVARRDRELAERDRKIDSSILFVQGQITSFRQQCEQDIASVRAAAQGQAQTQVTVQTQTTAAKIAFWGVVFAAVFGALANFATAVIGS